MIWKKENIAPSVFKKSDKCNIKNYFLLALFLIYTTRKNLR